MAQDSGFFFFLEDSIEKERFWMKKVYLMYCSSIVPDDLPSDAAPLQCA